MKIDWSNVNFAQIVCFKILRRLNITWGHTVAQMVEALRYKPVGRGFHSRWCYWNFSLT
jgi:hypothetical protein